MEYKIISGNYFNDVIIHLRNSFFSDEPLNQATGLCKADEGNINLEEQCCITLSDNMSLMAIKDNQIAGVILNGILRPGDILEAKKKLELINDENYKKIFELLYSFNLENDIFQYCNIDKIFDIRILSVDSKYRGQGIAKHLIENAEKLAKNYCFKVMKADATGIFSQKLLKSNGFLSIAEIYYDKYINENCEPILNVAPPHNKLELLYKEIIISDES